MPKHTKHCRRGWVTSERVSSATRGLVLVVLMGACHGQDAKSVGQSATDVSSPTVTTPTAPGVDSISAAPLNIGEPFGVRLGAATVWLDSTRFREAAAYLNALNRLTVFGHETAPWFLACSHTSGPDAQYILVSAYRSDTNRVVAVKLTRDAPRNPEWRAKCADVPLAGSNVHTTVAGFRLGATREAIERWAGAPSQTTSANYRWYMLASSDSARLDDVDLPDDRRVILIIEYRDDVAVSIDIHRNDESLVPRH